MTTQYPSEEEIVDMALDHVRTVCKGNGVKAEAISVVSHTVKLHHLDAATYLELKPLVQERHTPGKSVSGTLCVSREDARQRMEESLAGVARDPHKKKEILQSLLNRMDKGFGLVQQMIPLDFIKQDYTWHEICSTCRGSGRSQCPRCQGRRTEPCTKCFGRGLMMCPLCQGAGIIQGKKCPDCDGHRYISCDVCNRSGMMPCRTCSASGLVTCPSCTGHGAITHTIAQTAVGITSFEYEAQSIPKGAADVIEKSAASLVTHEQIKVEGRTAEGKDSVCGASYDVTFPYGEISFLIGKKEVTCGVFGYKASIVNFPFILDRLIQPGLEQIEHAANDQGDVAEKVREASKYRVIAQAIILSTRYPLPKTTQSLLRKYDIGLSQTTAETTARFADRAMTRIARKPRYLGLLAGLAGVFVFAACFYLSGLRAIAGAFLPDPRLDILLDLVVFATGVAGTTYAIRFFSAKAIRLALGHLLNDGQKRSLTPKTGYAGLFAYPATAAVLIGVIELSGHFGKILPHWMGIFP